MGTELAMPAFHTQYYFSSSLSEIPFCTFFANFLVSLGQSDFLSTLFENSYSLAFKLVLQNRLHGLSFTIVRLLSGQHVFLNFDQRLTASLRLLAIYKLPPPPPPHQFKKKYIFALSSHVINNKQQQLILYSSFLLSCIT